MPDPSEQLRPAASPVGADAAVDQRERALLARIRPAASRPGGLADPEAREALSELVQLYQDRLFAVCLRMVGGDRHAAADLTQDALLKLIQGLPGYDARSKFSTWAIRIAMNTCVSYLRSSKVRRHASLEAAGGNPASDNAMYGSSLEQGRELSGPEGVELAQRRRRVAAALASIEPEQRCVLVLRDVQGLDYEQIGDVLQVPIGTVKSRLFRARLALRDAIESSSSRS